LVIQVPRNIHQVPSRRVAFLPSIRDSRHAAMAEGRQAGGMDRRAEASKFLFVGQFAKTLRRDIEAVGMAISTRWNNGPLEGQVNRLKTLKRQMYGRAGFELLRARVLPWDPCHT
jgi:transposase